MNILGCHFLLDFARRPIMSVPRVCLDDQILCLPYVSKDLTGPQWS